MRKILSNYSPFNIELRGLNLFPRTVFIQVFDETQTFLNIYGDIHRDFPSLEGEHFGYVPHVSIADIMTKEACNLVALIENKYREKEIGQIDVNEIHIVRARPYLTVGRIETIETIKLKTNK